LAESQYKIERSLHLLRKKALMIELAREGATVSSALAHPDINATIQTYYSWRQRDHRFAYTLDAAISGRKEIVPEYTGTHASFAKTYFGMDYAWFQLEYINLLEQVPPGGILMALWPPEHGKTTTYENYA